MNRAGLCAGLAFTVLILVCSGCGGRVSSPAELLAFSQEPSMARVDLARLSDAKGSPGPYRIGVGDLLAVSLDDAIQPRLANEAGGEAPPKVYMCRVDSYGNVVLPILGEILVEGKTVSEVEGMLAGEYHPRFVNHTPNVVVKVEEFDLSTVTVLGSVERPGTQELRRDEMTLVGALMKAGGVRSGAVGAIRIRRAESPESSEKVNLPVKGMATPFKDIPLKASDIVEVDGQEAQVFTVVGLVGRPGAFPYPPNETYTIAQALAFAGGASEIAPDYVWVYRRTPEGKVAQARVNISGTSPSSAINVPVRPGDIVAVEHTTGSRTSSFLSRITRAGVNFGADYNMAQ